MFLFRALILYKRRRFINHLLTYLNFIRLCLLMLLAVDSS